MQEIKNIRNAAPVERRTETVATYAACNYASHLRAEKRCHRRVGDKNSVSRFHLLAMSKTYTLYRGIKNGVHQTGEGRSFPIYEPKYRIVTATDMCDRVAQAAFILDVFYPKVMPHMSDNNFACYAERGVDKARERFKEHLKNAKPDDCVLCSDFTAYFASIDHDKLIAEFLPLLGDENIGYYINVVTCNKKPVGLTLGNEVNQLSASSLPYRFDHTAEQFGDYSRYMDDIRFIGSKETCQKVLAILKDYANSMGLKLSENKTYIQPVSRPVSFLGFTFLRHPTGRVTLKRKRDKVNHEKRKLRKMQAKQIPFERVKVHYRSVRECMKKGERSGVVKLDKYFNNLFQKEIEQYEHNQSRQPKRSQCQESFIPLVTCGRKDAARNQNRVPYTREVFNLAGIEAAPREADEDLPRQ